MASQNSYESQMDDNVELSEASEISLPEIRQSGSVKTRESDIGAEEAGLTPRTAVLLVLVLLVCLAGTYLAVDTITELPSCEDTSTNAMLANFRTGKAGFSSPDKDLRTKPIEIEIKEEAEHVDDEIASGELPAGRRALCVTVITNDTNTTEGTSGWRNIMEDRFRHMTMLLGIREEDVKDIDVTHVSIKPSQVQIECEIFLDNNNDVYGRLKWFGIPFFDGKAYLIFFRKLVQWIFEEHMLLSVTLTEIECVDSFWENTNLLSVMSISPPSYVPPHFHMEPYAL